MPKTVSLYLDAVRFASAAAVFVFHLSHGGFGGRWLPLRDVGGDAVMAFFVLSGLIIAATAEREPNLSAFMNARLARLWSVVLPALLLTLALDHLGQTVDPKFYAELPYDGDHTAYRLVVSGLFLNEIWFRSVIPLSNLPFWSLGYEFWYYVLFAAAFYFSGWKRYLVVSGVAIFVGPKILLLLPVWLFGLFIYRLSRRWVAPEAAGWVMFLAPVPLYLWLLAAGVHPFFNDVMRSMVAPQLLEQLANAKDCLWFNLLGVLIAVNFLGFFAIQHRFAFLQRAESIIRRLAGCSFSCYLFHFPLFVFLASLLKPAPDSTALNLIIGIIAALIIGLIGPPAEASRHAWRRYLDSRMGGHSKNMRDMPLSEGQHL